MDWREYSSELWDTLLDPGDIYQKPIRTELSIKRHLLSFMTESTKKKYITGLEAVMFNVLRRLVQFDIC